MCSCSCLPVWQSCSVFSVLPAACCPTPGLGHICSGTACCSVWHRLTTCHRVSSGCQLVSFFGISLAAFLWFYDSSKYFWLPIFFLFTSSATSFLCAAKEDRLASHLNSAVNPCLRSGRNICCILKWLINLVAGRDNGRVCSLHIHMFVCVCVLGTPTPLLL